MQISISHPFIHQAHDLAGLIGGCRKVSTFMNRLEKQSVLFPDRYDPDKYKGDGFEFLVEAIANLMGTHPQIGIAEYHPVTSGDVGVDGVGKGVRNQTVTVQVKYRGKTNSVLTANSDHLSNFTSASMMHHNVEIRNPKNKKEKNMVIFTTADSLHHFTKEKMFMDTVRCIGYDDLRKMLDNNQIFWAQLEQLAVEAVQDYQEKAGG